MAMNERLMERAEYRNTEFQLLGILLQYRKRLMMWLTPETKYFLDPKPC